MKLEILDTTLRDGEQTSGVAFNASEKLAIARELILKVGVDRLEIASARVSEGEFHCVSKVCEWASKAGCLDRIEVLGFCDGGASIDWIKQAGCKVINLLTKGSERHCLGQLRKQPQEHWDDVRANILKAVDADLRVNIYLEDWSNGMKDSPEYVFGMLDALQDLPIEHFMLPDTLGILSPNRTKTFFEQVIARYPKLRFDFHAHNDYDLAVANVLAAAEAGCRGIHTTINGLGERAGNASLSSVVAVIHDMLPEAKLNIIEESISNISRMVESYSGIANAANAPIVGDNVFTQTAGVHADGDKKGKLYVNALLPERFGRSREYALGKMSGKANIEQNLKVLGISLSDEDMRRVTKRINELGDKKELVTIDDLPYIISDVLHHDAPSEKIRLVSYMVSTAYGLHPQACVKLEINGQEYEESATGDGMFDAFVRAVRHIYRLRLGRTFPWLTNYVVTIPPGGRTDALVQTVINWEYEGKVYRTRGLDADQTEAAIKATIKMLNLLEAE
ncbi:MAG: alpha-isopropylmalate synthase regulatory domain-containing protein [Bacteroidales bacterium]|nr:alpha-isopropylmalate synthase regulatory domain-containing protein [Bacteroidales bacterium]